MAVERALAVVTSRGLSSSENSVDMGGVVDG